MQLLEFIPIKFTILLVCGILVGFMVDLQPLVPILFTGMAGTGLGVLFHHQKNRESIAFGLTMAAVLLGIGATAYSLAQPANHSSHYSRQSFDNKLTWHLKIREVLKTGSFADRYIARVRGVGGQYASGKVLLNIRKDSSTQPLLTDDEIIARAVPENILPPLNPHQFSYKKYLHGIGIYHQLSLSGNTFIRRPDPARTVVGLADEVKEHILTRLKEAAFGQEELGVMSALLLGDRSEISTKTYSQYKDAGAVHILALSGLHIGILLLLLQFLLQPLSRLPHGNSIKLGTIVALLWAFAFIAGLSASLIRAVTMFSFVAYALYLERPANTFNILALSMFFILLLFNPMLLFQAGFQMSYAAVFAIVWIYPRLQRFWSPHNRLLRKVWQLLSVSLAAQLGVVPLAMYYFHQFPGLFFVSNLVIVPFLGVLLGLGIAVIALSIVGILPHFIVVLYDTLIHWMNSVVGWIARQEAFLFQNIPFDGVQLLLAYGIIIALITALDRRSTKQIALLLLAVITFQAWGVYQVSVTRDTTKTLLMHQTAHTVILRQQGASLRVLASDTAFTAKILSDYKIAERIRDCSFEELQNSYVLGAENLLLMDSLGLYPPHSYNTDIVVLTQSPKINLDRFLDSVHPARVLVDGSNYRSYVARWKTSCAERKIPFHYTGEQGAYEFSSCD